MFLTILSWITRFMMQSRLASIMWCLSSARISRRNLKTHLTNHCFGIRRGKSLSKVVKATRENTNLHSHISIFYKIHRTVINHG